MNDKKLSKNNIIQIVQIFDTDRAFIKKEFIEKEKAANLNTPKFYQVQISTESGRKK